MNNIDKFPIREDITVIEGDDPSEIKLGWIIHEIPPWQTIDEYYKENLSEEKYKEWQYNHSVERSQETDVADMYLSHCGETVSESGSFSSISLKILQVLYGQPWNNLSLNFVLSMEPKCLRVTTGKITLDSYPGRITVYLEKDNRTIKTIEKEVNIPVYGSHNGNDLLCKLAYQKEHGTLNGYKYDEWIQK